MDADGAPSMWTLRRSLSFPRRISVLPPASHLPDCSELASGDQRKPAPRLLTRVKFPSTNGAAGDVQGGSSTVHGCVPSPRSFKFILQSRKLPTWTLLRENPLGKSPPQKVILEPALRKTWFPLRKVIEATSITMSKVPLDSPITNEND